MPSPSRRSLPILVPFAFPLLTVLCGGCSDDEFPTPLESKGADALTSYDEMAAFLGALQDGTGAFSLDTIGSSNEGRSLFLLHFGDGENEASAEVDRLRVLIYAQQHGDEPSGKEAAIALARDLATGAFNEVLGLVDLYLIPQVNPDGSEMRQRRNAAGQDLNRDHLTLSSPEVAAVHSVFNDVMPHVTLDVHEYGIDGSAWVEAGWYKDFGQQIGALSNANMSMELRTYAWNRVIPEMAEALEPRDVQLRRYLVTDGPTERFRYSTTALNDGRNSMGIYNTLSFLIEGKNGLTVEDDIRERARQQLETMKAFLRFYAGNAAEVKGLVEAERAVLAGDSAAPRVALVMDYVRDPARPTISVGVVDIQTGARETRTFDNFDPKVEATLFVDRPLGYTVSTDQAAVLEVLGRHGIPVSILDQPLQVMLERYRVEGLQTAEKEDKEFLQVDVRSGTETVTLPAGTAIVWCGGIQSNLIVSLLEPQSQWGLAPLPEFVSMLREGDTYPISRILQVME